MQEVIPPRNLIEIKRGGYGKGIGNPYFGIIKFGSPRMARHARAQNA
jgi:hypothetical protein